MQKVLLAQPALHQGIGPQLADDQQRAEQQGASQWPAVERLRRARLCGLLGDGFKLVEGVFDRRQFFAIAGAKVLATGQGGDFLQCWLIQVDPRIDPEQALGAVFFRVGADADRVDFDPFFPRQSRGGERVDLPAIVGAGR